MNEFEMNAKNLRIFYRNLPESQLEDLLYLGGFLAWWEDEMSYLLCIGSIAPSARFLSLSVGSHKTAEIFEEEPDSTKWPGLKQFRSWLMRNADLHHRRLKYQNV